MNLKKINDEEVLPPIEKEGQTIQKGNSLSPSENQKEIKYIDVPFISFLIAHLSKFFDYNYYLTGTLIIPIFASLFILPLGIYFFRIGLPLTGLLGGLIGSFSSAYLQNRSPWPFERQQSQYLSHIQFQ